MKVKRKGNVYQFLSSPPPSPSSSPHKDPDSVLKLLPVTILALAFSLPNQDREVLAYLISRSIIATCSSYNAINQHHSNSKCRTTAATSGKSKSVKKVPPFECGCFDCYTSFWHRWDSSPNRELIHQLIEDFEEHLLVNESPRKNNRGGKKRGNTTKRVDVIKQAEEKKPEIVLPVAEDECAVVTVLPEKKFDGVDMKENGVVCREHEEEEEEKIGINEVTKTIEMEVVTVQAMGLGADCHKGFARKVLPDVVGLLNSRLWSLWSPSI
ncbi:uncharacterized protein LOC8269201 [Ricinus communis]|uniref:Uncharacterized protein n=1 Tax=Ricinus communis TaxID=3988 RepID=B9RAC7_RICCO|nr:uncharacterized protein LOC8269201 [Ricinus communis]EEF51754.1 conserved hypothetical protein [Ricinus communis]|eukprot:XP_002511152.1 uncharacterized protein LOC8269201 [Ricinus communis]